VAVVRGELVGGDPVKPRRRLALRLRAALASVLERGQERLGEEIERQVRISLLPKRVSTDMSVQMNNVAAL
jgi:hypothetical protein